MGKGIASTNVRPALPLPTRTLVRMPSFAESSAVQLVEESGDMSVWAADIESGWDVGGNTNGGYLMAIAGTRDLRATGRPDPVTITGHYLTPVGFGPAGIEVRVLRRGRRFSAASADADVRRWCRHSPCSR